MPSGYLLADSLLVLDYFSGRKLAELSSGHRNIFVCLWWREAACSSGEQNSWGEAECSVARLKSELTIGQYGAPGTCRLQEPPEPDSEWL